MLSWRLNFVKFFPADLNRKKNRLVSFSLAIAFCSTATNRVCYGPPFARTVRSVRGARAVRVLMPSAARPWVTPPRRWSCATVERTPPRLSSPASHGRRAPRAVDDAAARTGRHGQTQAARGQPEFAGQLSEVTPPTTFANGLQTYRIIRRAICLDGQTC